MMGREAQAVGHERLSEADGETPACIEVSVGARDEDRIALESIAVEMRPTAETPSPQKEILHRVVVDRDEQIGRHLVRAIRPLLEIAPRPSGRHQASADEAGSHEIVHDLARQPQIERVLVDPARNTGRAWRESG